MTSSQGQEKKLESSVEKGQFDADSACERGRTEAEKDDLGLYFYGHLNPRFNTRLRLLREEYKLKTKGGGCIGSKEGECYNAVMYERIKEVYGQDAFDKIERMVDSLYHIDQGDRSAQYDGGKEALLRYIYCNIDDELLVDEVKKAPLVIMQFTIEEDGHIENLGIVRRYRIPEDGQTYESVALDLINQMPDWKPSIQNGKGASTKYHLPIKFSKATKSKTCVD